jgi:hypothetical protein
LHRLRWKWTCRLDLFLSCTGSSPISPSPSLSCGGQKFRSTSPCWSFYLYQDDEHGELRRSMASCRGAYGELPKSMASFGGAWRASEEHGELLRIPASQGLGHERRRRSVQRAPAEHAPHQPRAALTDRSIYPGAQLCLLIDRSAQALSLVPLINWSTAHVCVL